MRSINDSRAEYSTYRTIADNTKEQIASRSYVMFKAMFEAIKDGISRLWYWWCWDQFVPITAWVLIVMVVVFSSYCGYNAIFNSSGIDGCYVKKSYMKYEPVEDNKYIRVEVINVVQDVQWNNNRTIGDCPINDLECLDKFFASPLCKVTR